MNIREQQESREHEYMSPYASFSDESRGRDKPEPQCDMRTIYQRDRDRILHSKSFRRLKHKTGISCTRGRSLQDKTYPYAGGCPDSKKHFKSVKT